MKRFPQFIEGARWSAEADGSFLLTHPTSGRTLRMGQLEHWILTALDGHTPPSELARNLSLVLGRRISEQSMTGVLRRLAEQGFVTLPPRPAIEVLPGARVHCCRSGHCCHLGVGPLTQLERERLAALPWAEQGEAPPAGEIFREADGQTFLVQRPEDAACVFLEASGSCRVHRVFGCDVKPAICRLFPLFTVATGPDRLRAGVCFECPGVGQAAPEQSLAREVAAAGELLFATRLQGPPPTLIPGELVEGGWPDEDPDALALEQEMLALLAPEAGWGENIHAALAECGRRLLEAAAPLPPGGSLRQWLGELGALADEQLEQLRSPYYRSRFEIFCEALRRFTARRADPAPPESGPADPLSPEVDLLLRRAWSNYVFTRFHFFRFGQLAGFSLLLLLHLLTLDRIAEAAASRGARPDLATASHLLAEVLDGLRALEVVQLFPAVGPCLLEELLACLPCTQPAASSEGILS